jgi:uncharacterized protein YjiS (DUF1127 family)
MSTLITQDVASVREIARAEASAFTFGRAIGLIAGLAVMGVEKVMTRAEIARSRRQLAQLDERLLRDIGIDRATARFEADRGFWS